MNVSAHGRWRWSWVALALTLGGCAKEPTEIVLVVDSDLPIPDSLGRIEIAAWSERAPTLRTAIDLTLESDLPRTLVLYPSNGESGRFSVSVLGLPGPDFRSVLVRRDVEAAFVSEETRTLHVFLPASCLYSEPACGVGETCGEHGCRPIEVNESELSPWEGRPPPRPGACVAREEACNDRDDDCDGERDEDFDRATDALHCGVCGQSCADGDCAFGYCPGRMPVEIAAGTAHTCVRRESGAISCFGWNGAGQIGADSGDGDSLDAERPLDVPVSDAAGLSLGGAHSCVLHDSGRVSCWGDNTHGELGDGSGRPRLTPAEVVDLGALAVAAGIRHSCAVRESGTVACWGDNAFGQLGRAAGAGSAVAIDVVGMAGVSAVAVGGRHSCALARGVPYCWGDNQEGQLGDGTTISRSAPAPVDGASGIVGLVAGRLHTCALGEDGDVTCWGRNLEGQLGDGTRDRRSSPAPVSVGAAATALAAGAGGSHTCALLDDGTVACWGANAAGQLGDGTLEDRATPLAVSGVSRVVSIAAAGEATGAGHTCSVDRDGAVYCWGRGGQYRTGTFFPQDTMEPTPAEELPYRHLPGYLP